MENKLKPKSGKPTGAKQQQAAKPSQKPAAKPKSAASKPKAKKSPNHEKEATLDVRQRLSDKELAEAGKELADIIQRREALEAERKASAKDFKAKIEALEKLEEGKAEIIRERSQIRPIRCIVKYDDPKSGWKTAYSKEDGKPVGKAEKMTPEELQMLLAV